MSDITINNKNGIDYIEYQPNGVCSKLMRIAVKDNIVNDIEIVGGCNGNLTGISNLVRGMNINDIVSRLDGIPCGSRGTSCPDQLATAIKMYIENKQVVKA